MKPAVAILQSHVSRTSPTTPWPPPRRRVTRRGCKAHDRAGRGAIVQGRPSRSSWRGCSPFVDRGWIGRRSERGISREGCWSWIAADDPGGTSAEAGNRDWLSLRWNFLNYPAVRGISRPIRTGWFTDLVDISRQTSRRREQAMETNEQDGTRGWRGGTRLAISTSRSLVETPS